MYLFRNPHANPRDELEEGMRLYTDGYRIETIPIFQNILVKYPEATSYTLTSASLIAETYRVINNYSEAIHYYEFAIHEGEKIPISERKKNEWYSHYAPRIRIGLFMALRRSLSSEHKKFKELLTYTKETFSNYSIPDLAYQLELIEGLYYRQLGSSYLNVSVDLIESAEKEIYKTNLMIGKRSVEGYYLFLHPEHFSALSLYSHLCLNPLREWNIIEKADLLITKYPSPWCKAVAALSLIHLNLRINSLNEIRKNEDIIAWLSLLSKEAQFERDPILLTEAYILGMLLGIIHQNKQLINENFSEFYKCNENIQKPNLILRTAEIACLQSDLIEIGNIEQKKINELLSKGNTALAELENNIRTYNITNRQIESWKNSFSINNFSTDYINNWSSPELQSLRALVWP